MRLDGKTAMVTGAASGIGAAVVRTFARAGARAITLVDVNEQQAELVAEEVSSECECRLFVSKTDVSQGDQVRQMVDETIRQFGEISILVNNAGIAPAVHWPDVTEENWRQVMETNLHGAFLCLLTVAPHMRQKQWGRIINISSVGAFQGSITAHPAYGVSKAGILALTKSAAKEFAADGILVNAISPGSIETPLARQNFTEQERQAYAEAALLKRHGTATELADSVLFLASDRSTYITGATLHVNGGSLLV